MSGEGAYSSEVDEERLRRERKEFVLAVRQALADERDRSADDREKVADFREAQIDRRERRADETQRHLIGAESGYSSERRAGRFDTGTSVGRREEGRAERAQGRAERAESRIARSGRAEGQAAGRWQVGGSLARQSALLAAELYAEETLEAVLARVARSAVTVVPGCDIATVTFGEGNHFWTPVASDAAGERFDRLQYALREGPCIDATESTVCATSGDWSRWPRLAERSGTWPVAAVMSCRIAVGGGRVRPHKAALNLYSTVSGGLGPEAHDPATVLAAHASVAVATARERSAVSQSETGFRQALASRQVIGQATGMLMERQGISAEDAFDILRRASQRMNVKLRLVAADLTSSRRPLTDESEQPNYDRLGRSLDYLLGASGTVPPDILPLLAGPAAERLGISATTAFLADYGQRRLLPFPSGPDEKGFDIEGTMGGRAFVTGEPVEVRHPDDTLTLWVPLVDGVQVIGVVAFALDRIDGSRTVALSRLATLLAGEIVARSQYTDAVATARRDGDMTVGAELAWERSRPPTFATDRVSVAAALEPSYEVAGDAYDYAYNHPHLHLSIFDAVGHDVRAGLVASLAVAAYRHARRDGAGVVDAADAIDQVIRDHFADEAFATAVLASLDTTSGHLTFVNAGHPPPMLLRRGQIIGPLTALPRAPLGLRDTVTSATTGVGSVQLEPDDRVLLYSDGIIEARSATGEDFGLDRLGDFIRRNLTTGRSEAEFVRRLAHAVVDHHHGQLNDDATVVVLHWKGSRGSAGDIAEGL